MPKMCYCGLIKIKQKNLQIYVDHFPSCIDFRKKKGTQEEV